MVSLVSISLPCRVAVNSSDYEAVLSAAKTPVLGAADFAPNMELSTSHWQCLRCFRDAYHIDLRLVRVFSQTDHVSSSAFGGYDRHI